MTSDPKQPSKLDEILSNLLEFQNDRGKVRGITFAEAKAQISALMDEVIGEDESIEEYGETPGTQKWANVVGYVNARNQQRAYQRKRKEELLG